MAAAYAVRLPRAMFRWLRVECNLWRGFQEACLVSVSEQVQTYRQVAPYLVLHTIYFFQLNTDRILSRLIGGNIAHPVGCEIGMAILVIRDLVFPIGGRNRQCPEMTR